MSDELVDTPDYGHEFRAWYNCVLDNLAMSMSIPPDLLKLRELSTREQEIAYDAWVRNRAEKIKQEEQDDRVQ